MELELVWLGRAELKWAESRGGRVSVSELLYFLLPTLRSRVRTYDALHGSFQSHQLTGLRNA